MNITSLRHSYQLPISLFIHEKQISSHFVEHLELKFESFVDISSFFLYNSIMQLMVAAKLFFGTNII